VKKKDPSVTDFFSRIHTIIIEIVLLILLILACVKLIGSEWSSLRSGGAKPIDG